MADGSQRTFRITFWRPWLLAVAILAAPALIAAGAFALSGQLGTVAGILGGLAVAAALLALPVGWSAGSGATRNWRTVWADASSSSGHCSG